VPTALPHGRSFRRSAPVWALLMAGLSITACGDGPVDTPLVPMEVSADFINGPATSIKYDAKNEAEYLSMWANIYGPLELAAGGTRSIQRNGEITVAARRGSRPPPRERRRGGSSGGATAALAASPL